MGQQINKRTKKSERKKMSKERKAYLALYNKRGNSLALSPPHLSDFE